MKITKSRPRLIYQELITKQLPVCLFYKHLLGAACYSLSMEGVNVLSASSKHISGQKQKTFLRIQEFI